MKSFENVDLTSEHNYDFVLDVEGNGCRGSFASYSFDFLLPADTCGAIALSTEKSWCGIVFSKLKLTSTDNVEKVVAFAPRTYTLPSYDGGMLEYRLELSVDRYRGNYCILNYTLSGGISERPNKPLTMDCWIVQNDAFESPYLRVEGRCTSPNLYIKNGTLITFDPNGNKLTEQLAGAAQLPITGSIPLDFFDENCSFVFGYDRFCTFGCEYHAGAREYVYAQDGRLLYTGESLQNELICKVSSGKDKKIVQKIPTSIERHDDAVEHAVGNHYFFDDESVQFSVDIHTKLDCRYLSLTATLENVFGDALSDWAVSSVGNSDMLDAFGLTTVCYRIEGGKLPLGVYHLVLRIFWGSELVETHISAFEVFEEASDRSPQMASELPFIYVGDGTPYDLENSYPNPWMKKPDFNIGHYINCAHYQPPVAERDRVWELMPLYRREWLVWMTRRTIGGQSYHDYPGCVAHADYINYVYPGIEDSGHYFRCDMWSASVYTKALRSFLQDYLDENPEYAAALNFGDVMTEFTSEMLYKLLDVCGTSWVDYSNMRLKELFDRQWAEIKALNPKAKRSSYGPWPVYSVPFQGGYSTKWYGFAPETLSEVFDGFLQYEDYPFSCAYHTYRGAWGIMTTKLLCDDIRIFPEMYESFYDGCPDGAVAYAYPPLGGSVSPAYFNVTQAYEAAMTTAYWKNGSFNYWRDYGFMMFPLGCRKPEERFDCLLRAWGHLMKNKPVRPLRCTAFLSEYVASDERFDRDYDSQARYNLSEAAEGYLYGCLREVGLPAGFVTNFAGLSDLDESYMDVLILPSLVGASQKTIERIRDLYEAGVSLIAVSDVEGLEDLFGVRKRFSMQSVHELHYGDQSELIVPFEAEFHYEAIDAEVLMYADTPEAPVLLKKGRAVLFNSSLGHVGVDGFLKFNSLGRDNVSTLLREACKKQLKSLSAPIAAAAENCGITLYQSEEGETLLLLTDYSAFDQNVVLTQHRRVTVNFQNMKATDVEFLSYGVDDIHLNTLHNGETLDGFTVRIRPQQSLLFRIKN